MAGKQGCGLHGAWEWCARPRTTRAFPTMWLARDRLKERWQIQNDLRLEAELTCLFAWK
jgi:hypothetical protein